MYMSESLELRSLDSEEKAPSLTPLSSSQYDNYCSFLSECNFEDFKISNQYCGILEHVTKELGDEYLQMIDSEFDISHADVVNFSNINDCYGNPKKYTFFSEKHKKIVTCSPSSLRYIYHGLLILQYYKNTELHEIVEIGCGYGGLCLSINYFSKLLQINITKYHLIDLPEVCNLIDYYLHKNAENITIPFQTYKSNNYGEDVPSKELFLISNYCFTEIDEIHRNNYCEKLLTNVKRGFILWQTCACSLDHVHKLQKNILHIELERPQTCVHSTNLNKFVYF